MKSDHLLELLTGYRSGDSAFNQYRDIHPDLDLPAGASIRLRNLQFYLNTFAEARHILVGEAAGYAGCRFSGIPFTSEAHIVSATPRLEEGRPHVRPPSRQLAWAAAAEFQRSSTAEQLWLERSATIVWEALEGRRDCILWNAFPWHPFGDRGPLSNRAPGRDLADGLETLACLLSLYPSARPIAVGRVAQRAMAQLGIEAPYIRHPSRGGKRCFIEGVAALGSPSSKRASQRSEPGSTGSGRPKERQE